MHRITDANRAVDKFGVGKDGFRDGDKSTGVVATRPAAVTFDVFQEELVNAVEAAGITLSTPGGDYAQLREAIKRLAGGMLRGSRTGVFSRTSNSQITLAPFSGDTIAIEIDGVLREAPSFVSDLTTHIATGEGGGGGSVAVANTVYYVYAKVAVGGIASVISVTPPATTGKVGYHTTRTSERCVFAMRTKAASAVWAAFDETPDRMVLLRTPDVLEYSIAATLPTTYTAQDLTGVPATASEVMISARVEIDDARANYAHEALVGTAVAGNLGQVRIGGASTAAERYPDATTFLMAVDSTPRIAYGFELIGGTNTINLHALTLMGWRNRL